MKYSTRIVIGIFFLILGIGWVLELTGLVRIDLNGWWTLFIIVPCFVSLFDRKYTKGALVGLGIGVLLLLATREIILWADIWKYILSLLAVVWGLSLIFGRKGCCDDKKCDCCVVSDKKESNQDGRQIHIIDVSFGRQQYEFGGQRFEGAKVQTSFGFTLLDLRGADLMDGAVVKVECSFGGMEVRVDRDVCVKSTVESAFGSVDNKHDMQDATGAKTLYLQGQCNFGGIEIK